MPAEHDAKSRLSTSERLAWARQAFVALAIVWVALDGTERWPAGVVVAVVGAGLAAAIAVGRPYRWRVDRLAVFVAYFVAASFRGGVDVAYRAMHPALPIGPRFVQVPLDLPPGQPRSLMVIALSLMPGTLSADLLDDGRTLVVHVLTERAAGSIDELQRRVARLFGLGQPAGAEAARPEA
jgi:multicomponent Na+:H+ antiporter subunit E